MFKERIDRQVVRTKFGMVRNRGDPRQSREKNYTKDHEFKRRMGGGRIPVPGEIYPTIPLTQWSHPIKKNGRTKLKGEGEGWVG